MKNRKSTKASVLTCILVLLTASLLMGLAAPSFGWPWVNKLAYHFRAVNNTGQFVNDAEVWGTGRALPFGWWTPPVVQAAHISNMWPPTPLWAYTNSGTVGIWRWARFGPGVPLPPGGWAWINVDFAMLGSGPAPKLGAAFHVWTFDYIQRGPWTWLGWRVASAPALYNPPGDARPPGTPGVTPMVVRNLQFAVSPNRIPNDSTRLDNPYVQQLFNASQDSVRPGPFIVPPGDTLEITPPLDPSITEPQVGGSTVLAKGTVEDSYGVQVEFVVQFIAEKELGVPAVSHKGAIILTLLLVTVATVFILRLRYRMNASV